MTPLTTTCAHIEAMAVSDTRAWLSRRLTLALAALALLGGGIAAPAARAQLGNTVIRQFNGVPSGACANIQIAVNLLNGDLYDCLTGGWHLVSSAGGAGTFDLIGSGVNTSATMTLGTGGTLTFSGSGINNASAIRGVSITGTPSAGQIPISSSSTAAAWGDPIIQGTQAAGSTTIPNPLVSGGSDYGGTPTIRTWKVDSAGSGHLTIDNASSIMGNCGATTVNAHQYCGNNTAANGVAPGFVVPVLSDIAASSSANSYTFTASQSLTGGGSLQGTWVGGPTATIASAPTGVTEAGNTVTVTTSAVCTVTQNQPIRISGVAVASYNGDFTAHSDCAGSSTFTYINQYAGLAASGGGTVVGAPIFNAPFNISGLLKTGTGLSSLVPNGQNTENVCGSLASPFVGDTGAVQNALPCTHSLMYYGTPVTANGFGNSVHRSDLITATGIDVRSPVSEYHNTQCNSSNSGGFASSNATNCIASVGVTNGSGQAGQTASDFVAQCSFAGVGVQLCQANENLVNTGRAGGWQHSYVNTWAPLNSATIQSGSQNISTYFFSASSAAGKSALIGEYITDVLNAGHLVTHGATQRPDTGYWSGGATTAGFRSSCAPVYSTNGGSTPNYGSDCPTYGFLGEENAVTNGSSQQFALISTNSSGTAATIASSPTGLVQSDFTVTVTTTAPCSFTTGQPIAITGAGNALYNGNFRVLSPGCNGGSTFTYYNASNGPGSTTATISSLSESGSTVTATMSATCTFATGMTVNVQPPIPILNPRTTDNGYYGFFTVLTPGCNGGTSFTYTNSVTGLGALGAVGTVESYLPPSGGGTATGGTQQTWAMQHTPDKILHFTYCATSFACAGSEQLTYQACPTIGSTFCGIGVHDSGSQRFRVGYSNTSIAATKIVPIQMQYFSGGDLQIGSRSTAVSIMQFFTSPDAGTTGLVERLRLNADGGIQLPEIAAPAAAAAADICYGDATAHALKCSYNNGSFFNMPQTIASGTSAMTTAGIATGACGTTVTTAATGTLTTDSIEVARNAAPTNANGGNLVLNWWPTAGNVNFNYCNPSAGTVTPTAMTINWRVIR